MNGTFSRLEVSLRVFPVYSSRCLLFMSVVTAIYDVFNCSSKKLPNDPNTVVLKNLQAFKEYLK